MYTIELRPDKHNCSPNGLWEVSLITSNTILSIEGTMRRYAAC